MGTTLAIAFFVAVNMATAMSGAYFKPGAWYERLNKPTWNPPNWLFPIAWTLFYATIAWAGYMVWRDGTTAQLILPMTIYFIHLGLNAAWSYCFFGLRRPGLALVEWSALWVSVGLTIWSFYPVNANAALLLVPYFIWVSFAGFLNFTLWRLNPRASEMPA